MQALCAKCNRAKRANDDTDFRRRNKLVRDKIPEQILAENRNPKISQLSGRKLRIALDEKLIEEHEEYIESRSIGELVDIAEVVIAIAKTKGVNEEAFLNMLLEKRSSTGGFDLGYFYHLDS